jgi:cell division protein FtsB
MKHLVAGLLLSLILYFGWLTWFGNRGNRALSRVEDEIVATREHIQELEAENQRLTRRIRLLQSDSRYQELMVRRELKLIREDEIIFVFKPSSAPRRVAGTIFSAQ